MSIYITNQTQGFRLTKGIKGMVVFYCPSLRKVKVSKKLQGYWRREISRSYRLHWISKKKS